MKVTGVIALSREKDLWIRKAEQCDADFVYALRTRSEDRECYLTTVKSKEVHRGYWELNHCAYSLVLKGAKRAGYFGLVENDFRIAVLPEFRGQGIGGYILEHVKCSLSDKTIRIVAENKPSLNLFLRSGFKVQEEVDGVILLRLPND